MRLSIISLFALIFVLLAPLGAAFAQSAPAVQELQGSLAPGETDIFLLPGLKQGQTLTAFMENTSGNLDPILGILPDSPALAEKLASYQKAVAELVASSSQPLLDIPALRDQYLLAWDDDGGHGYSAALNFTVPDTGDYILIASSSLSAAGRQTAGNYRLLVGLDAPAVLAGAAASTGAQIALPNQTTLAIPACPGTERHAWEG